MCNDFFINRRLFCVLIFQVKLDSESKTSKKPKAEGYPDNTTILFKQLPVSTYMACKNPAIALQDAYEVRYCSFLFVQTVAQLPLTNININSCYVGVSNNVDSVSYHYPQISIGAIWVIAFYKFSITLSNFYQNIFFFVIIINYHINQHNSRISKNFPRIVPMQLSVIECLMLSICLL